MADTAHAIHAKTDLANDAALAAEVKALQASFKELLSRLEGDTGTLDGLTNRAKRVGSLVAAKADSTTRLLTDEVEEHPLLAVLIAFGVGMVGGKLLSR